jgi:hypothetical protein
MIRWVLGELATRRFKTTDRHETAKEDAGIGERVAEAFCENLRDILRGHRLRRQIRLISVVQIGGRTE